MTYRLIQEKAFPVVRIGSAMRIRPEDLRAYVQRLIENPVAE
jgi:excisionase family DNA binding protein